MKIISTLGLSVAALLVAQISYADMNDEPVLYSVSAHRFEWRNDSGQDAFDWDLEAWLGTTRDRFVLRTEGQADDAATEKFETLLLYSRAVSPYWNVNAGWRGNWQPATRRSWATVELEGLAPGFVETRLSLLMGAAGRISARAEFGTEWSLSQRWSLNPRLEADWYSKDDRANEIEAGLREVEIGLRLAYMVQPKLKPYLGVEWSGLLGDTADLARAAGAARSKTQWVAGVAFWF